MDTSSATRLVGRREAHKRATRATVLDAARHLFGHQGYEHTTVREIADAAGVTERTFYRYFRGKEDLLAEDAVAWKERLCNAIRKRPATEGPYVAVQRAMLATIRDSRRPADAGPISRLVELPRPLELVRQSSPRPLRQLEAAIADAVRARRGAAEVVFDDEVLARLVIAVLRSAAIRHRELLAATGTSPGLTRLLTDTFAIVASLARET